MNLRAYFFMILLLCAASMSCGSHTKTSFNVDEELEVCLAKAIRTLQQIPSDSIFPRRITLGDSTWTYIKRQDWTSGFWPGILWYAYEYTGEQGWKDEADKFSRYLVPLSRESAKDHDLGFQIYCSFGNGYRLTKDPFYKEVILRTADTLATLYNRGVGTIMSWPFRTNDWGPHNTIIDNMMNLEMLLWASKEDPSKKFLYDLSIRHADQTKDNHFREDYGSYHIIAYDLDGTRNKAGTYQGYADESLWARGQAWAIYGYMIMYRETNEGKYKDFLDKIAQTYVNRLPEDAVPYWDFDDPNIPQAARDASSAAIVASAFLQYADLLNREESKYYYDWGIKMLNSLVAKYKADSHVPAFLLHSTGSKTSEIDVSINYADYYYIEALMHLKKSFANN